jgi:hypothetical protein
LSTRLSGTTAPDTPALPLPSMRSM